MYKLTNVIKNLQKNLAFGLFLIGFASAHASYEGLDSAISIIDSEELNFKSTFSPCMTIVNCVGHPIAGEGLSDYLLRLSGEVPDLYGLDVSETTLNQSDIDAVASFKNLKWLSLENCSLRDSNLKVLGSLSLVALNISHNDIGLEGCSSSPLEKLQLLICNAISLNENELAELHKTHTQLKIDAESCF